MAPIFPVLLVSGATVMVLEHALALRRALALATDKAFRDNFFKEAVIVDSNSRRFRFATIRLSGRSGVLGWLKKPRRIDALELEPQGTISLSTVKELVHIALAHDDGTWEENPNFEEIKHNLEQAASFTRVADIFR